MKPSSTPTTSSSSTNPQQVSGRSIVVFCIIGVMSFAIGLMIGIVITPTYLMPPNNNNINNQNTNTGGSSSTKQQVSLGVFSSPAPNTASPDSSTSNGKNKKRTPEEIRKDPKIAFVGYMDRVPNAGYEVKWMYFSAFGSNIKGDILLMGHPDVGQYVPNFCRVLRGVDVTLEKARAALREQRCGRTGWPGNTSVEDTELAPVPCRVRCLVIANAKDDEMAVSLQYPFLRSLHFPNDPVLPQLLREDYDYILKTDLDVFFTPEFHKLHPPPGRIYGGRGAYVFYDDVSNRLKRISKDLKLHHRSLHNVGATWYGDAETILLLTALARNVTIHILKEEFKTGPGKWAGWYRGVSSMYGGEIAVNHLASNYMKGQLDMPCSNSARTCQGSLIHAWHQAEVFSKFDYHKYNAKQTLEEAHAGGDEKKFRQFMSRAGNYALYVAMNVKSNNDVPPRGAWGSSICL